MPILVNSICETLVIGDGIERCCGYLCIVQYPKPDMPDEIADKPARPQDAMAYQPTASDRGLA